MTLPSQVRVFFAVGLSESAREKVNLLITSLKKNAKSHAIRWTRPENLHITLQFLASVNAEDLTPLVVHVRSKLATKKNKISLKIDKLRIFPSSFHPRVIVLDIQPQEELSALSEAIGQGIQQLQYPIEDRLFRAHLTLARIKQPHGINLSFLSSTMLPVIEEESVNEVILYRSDPHPEGSRYTIVEKIML